MKIFQEIHCEPRWLWDLCSNCHDDCVLISENDVISGCLCLVNSHCLALNLAPIFWCLNLRALDTIHLVLIGQSAYHYLITNWGYQPALARFTWEFCVQLLFIGSTTFTCQLFFLRRQVCQKYNMPLKSMLNPSWNRIWIFGKGNIFIVGPILAICFATLGLHIVFIVQILRNPLMSVFAARKGQIIAVFTLDAAGMGSGQSWLEYALFYFISIYSWHHDCWFFVLLPSTSLVRLWNVRSNHLISLLIHLYLIIERNLS